MPHLIFCCSDDGDVDGSNLRVSRSSSNSADSTGVDGWELSRNSSNSADDDADTFDAELAGKQERRQVTPTKYPFSGDFRQHAKPVGPSNPRRSSPHSGRSALDISCAALRTNLIGRLDPVETPFGSKPLVCEFALEAGIHCNVLFRTPWFYQILFVDGVIIAILLLGVGVTIFGLMNTMDVLRCSLPRRIDSGLLPSPSYISRCKPSPKTI